MNIFYFKPPGTLISDCRLLPCCRRQQQIKGIDMLNKDKTNIVKKNI